MRQRRHPEHRHARPRGGRRPRRRRGVSGALAVWAGVCAIMTGAPMPAGADTVYPQEIVERAGARVRIARSAKGVNVRRAARTCEAGGIVIEAGTVAAATGDRAGHLARPLAARVHRRPRVALLSTGDEVAEPGTPRKPGQIYDANRFTLRGSIEQAGGEVLDLGIVPDVRETLRAQLLEAARWPTSCVTSGGVSVGVYDLVKEVLGELGTIDFWQVAMQPGRPLAFGTHRRRRRSSACPATRSPRCWPSCSSSGRRSTSWPGGAASVRPTWHARTTERLPKKTGRREFKRGILRYRDGAWEVRSTGPQGSGILLLDGRRQLPDRARRGSWRRGAGRARAWSSRSPSHCERDDPAITVDLIDRVKLEVRDLLRDAARRLPHLPYADLRLEVAEGKFATAENGESKSSGDDYGFAAGVRVLAGDRMVAPGWSGLTLGTADLDAICPDRSRRLLERAYRRAHGQRRAQGRRAREVRRARRRRSPTRACTRSACARTPWRRCTPSIRDRAAGRHGGLHHRRLAPGGRRRSGHQAQLHLHPHPARPRAVRLHRGRADRSVLRPHAGHGARRGRGWARSARSCTTSWGTSAAGRSSPAAWPRRRSCSRRSSTSRSPWRARAWSWPPRPALPTSAGEEVVVTDPHYNTLRLARDRRPPGRARPRAQDGDGLRGPLVAAAAASTTPGGPADRLAPGDRVLRSLAARLRPLRLRPRGHAGPPRVAHRPGHLHRLHEQPADRGDLRRRAQRPLQGHRRRRWSR